MGAGCGRRGPGSRSRSPGSPAWPGSALPPFSGSPRPRPLLPRAPSPSPPPPPPPPPPPFLSVCLSRPGIQPAAPPERPGRRPPAPRAPLGSARARPELAVAAQDRIQRPRVLSDLCNHDRPSRDLNKGRVSADADADVETQRRGAARLGIRSRRGGAGPLSQDPDTTAGVCAKPPDCSPDPLG